MIKSAKLSALFIALVVLFACAQPASAFMHQQEGAYLSLELCNLSLGGDDFDGTTFYEGSDFIGYVPTIPAGKGVRLCLGGFVEKNAAFEIAFTKTAHDGKWGTSDLKSTLANIAIEMQLIFKKRSKFQPYIAGGLALGRLNVHEGFTEVSNPDFTDAAFNFGMIYGGAGARLFVARKIALKGSLERQSNRFYRLKGGGESYKIEAMIGRGWHLRIGAIFMISEN
ncbi:MAG: outer membrane beta-barrel protein [candidate division Zixibacteria bacterium]|nr:outer membrane beta-barrel protein [candidate division Zixibacteria bacterium]